MSVQTTKDSQINYRIELLPRPSSPEVARRILSILDESLSDKILTPSHHHRLMHSTDRDSAARAFFLSTLGPRFDPSNVNADWQEEDPGLACEVWTSSDAEGIQGVMTFNLPDKSHTYEKCSKWSQKYAIECLGKLHRTRRSWNRTVCDITANARSRLETRGYRLEQSIEITFLATDSKARRSGHASGLIEQVKSVADENGVPAWLIAHHESTVQFYENRGFKRQFTEYLPLNAEGKKHKAELTIMTYGQRRPRA